MFNENLRGIGSIWIECPIERPDSFSYVLGIITDRFGVSGFSVRSASRNVIRIGSTLSESVYEFPCEFLTMPQAQWLSFGSLPRGHLEFLDCSKEFPIFLQSNSLPVFMPEGHGEILISNNCIHIPVDIFGTIYFMLTRYEEYVNLARDSMGRFSMKSSILRDKEIYSYPIVDLYLILLENIFLKLAPDISIKKRLPKIDVSCDVDHPFFYAGGIKTRIKRLIGDIFKRRSLRAAALTSLSFFKNMDDIDCYLKALKFIIEVNCQAGNSATFFFIPISNHKNDNNNSVSDSRIYKLMKLITDGGHKVGVHPGFLTFMNDSLMREAIDAFKKPFFKLSSSKNYIYSRQHYLMWEVSKTPKLLAKNNVDIDCSLGFNDHPGFRAGTCHQFPLFDPRTESLIGIIESPLIVMEWSLFSPNYMGIDDLDIAKKILIELKEKCFSVDGSFSILWHNNHLVDSNYKKLYEDIIFPFGEKAKFK